MDFLDLDYAEDMINIRWPGLTSNIIVQQIMKRLPLAIAELNGQNCNTSVTGQWVTVDYVINCIENLEYNIHSIQRGDSHNVF